VNLVDSSLWIDYFRRKTALGVKRQIAEVVNGADVVTCEPILFELLRATSRRESLRVKEYFATVPQLSTPATLWRDAIALGQRCFAAGFLPRAMDLLIAHVCLAHECTLTTFDEHFAHIAKVSRLKLNLLVRASVAP
jgi:predicted nucleic acid-binding protein